MSAALDVPRFSEPQMVMLAREIAMGIFPLSEILAKFKVPLQDYERFQRHPRFTALVEQFSAEWSSTLNTPERVKIKAQAIVEDVLPEFYNMMTDRKESMAAKVEALKTMRALGGLVDKADINGGGERFQLTINIGDGKPRMINVTPGPQNLTSGVNDELAGGIE